MYQELLSDEAYNSWHEYCTLVELAKQEYEEELAKSVAILGIMAESEGEE